jgi:Uncharacterized homolog of the cytoplasmic domain of flagellar protein FhlB
MKEFKKNKKAAALKYDPIKNGAPVLVAKGRGEFAEKILEIAKKRKYTDYSKRRSCGYSRRT